MLKEGVVKVGVAYVFCFQHGRNRC